MPRLRVLKGTLTPEKSQILKKFYSRVFELFQKNLDVSDRIRREGGPASASLEKDRVIKTEEAGRGPSAASDEASQEDAKHQEELREMTRALEIYGGDYLRTAFYDFVKVRIRRVLCADIPAL